MRPGDLVVILSSFDGPAQGAVGRIVDEGLLAEVMPMQGWNEPRHKVEILFDWCGEPPSLVLLGRYVRVGESHLQLLSPLETLHYGATVGE